MRNNQIINSSIIINIIVNGKNKTAEEENFDWSAETTPRAFDDVDPAYWMHVQEKQLPDFGLLKINGERPFIRDEATTEPEN